MFGQYKRLANQFDGVLTGKGLAWGGSFVRKEATGYGCVYFANYMLADRDHDLKNKRCAVSGSGNVAIYTMEKLYELGAKPVTCSDSSGTIYHDQGIDLDLVKQLKEQRNERLEKYLETHSSATYTPREDYPSDGHQVWRYEVDLAFPCATQNEVTRADIECLLENGCIAITEGANMPLTESAFDTMQESQIAYGPGKASNAGGVATSQLEMAQNASMQRWTFEQVDERLQQVMKTIYKDISRTAEEFGKPGQLVLGANIAGFRKVADAMLEQGLV